MIGNRRQIVERVKSLFQTAIELANDAVAANAPGYPQPVSLEEVNGAISSAETAVSILKTLRRDVELSNSLRDLTSIPIKDKFEHINPLKLTTEDLQVLVTKLQGILDEKKTNQV